jgi:hypothetical protein
MDLNGEGSSWMGKVRVQWVVPRALGVGKVGRHWEQNLSTLGEALEEALGLVL